MCDDLLQGLNIKIGVSYVIRLASYLLSGLVVVVMPLFSTAERSQKISKVMKCAYSVTV